VSWDNNRQSVLGLSWHFIASALHLRDCSWSWQLKSTSDSVTSRVRRKYSVVCEVDICYRLACVDNFTQWQKLRNGAVYSPFFGRLFESSIYITSDIDAGWSKVGKSKGLALR